MSWLKTVWAEFVGLFIDDATLAIGIAAWLAIVLALFHFALAPPPWRGPLLFLGLAALFIENTFRRARK